MNTQTLFFPSNQLPRSLRQACITSLAPVAILVLVLLLALAPSARGADANPPGKLTYQGFLTDAGGVPLGNTAPINTNIIFRIWTGSSNGTLKWAEQQTVTIDKGHFSVLLGEGTQFASEFFTNNLSTIFVGSDASDRYMEITLGNNTTTISPRMQFLPAPFAMLAANARSVVDQFGNTVISSTGSGANLTGINAGNIASGTLPSARLAGTYSSALTLNNSGNSLSDNGANLTALNAFSISTGSLSDARLSSNVALRSGGNSFTGYQSVMSGYVGIGTTSPSFPLDVQSFGGNYTPGYTTAYLGSDGLTTSYNGTYFGVSIRAEGEILAAYFGAMSDARIKSVLGISDSSADLNILRGIEITDYKFKDVIGKGDRPQKKVVAQQVEKIFPQAVSQTTDVIPDIFKRAFIKGDWITLVTDLKAGERVRLINEKGEQSVHEVLEVKEGAFRTDWKSGEMPVFVYGREVKDFRTVDYEAIAMLNVSATQELARRLETKDAEITSLKKQLAEQTARSQSNESRLASLEKLVRTLSATISSRENGAE